MIFPCGQNDKFGCEIQSPERKTISPSGKVFGPEVGKASPVKNMTRPDAKVTGTKGKVFGPDERSISPKHGIISPVPKIRYFYVFPIEEDFLFWRCIILIFYFMVLKIRKEEYTALGDFIKTSFVRDQAAIMARFPKLNAAFLADFTAKLDAVKVLESGLVLTEEQKTATEALYVEATALNKELNFLSSYAKEAGLNTDAITALKNDLRDSNIEGALLKIESVKQFVVAHSAALEDEGMAAGFAVALENHKVSMAAKNALQNAYMNSRKQLTDANAAEYKALYGFITKIVKAGKLVFDGTVTKDEYVITKTVGRMRAAKGNSSGAAPTA